MMHKEPTDIITIARIMPPCQKTKTSFVSAWQGESNYQPFDTVNHSFD